MKTLLISIAIIAAIGTARGQFVEDQNGNFYQNTETVAPHDSTTGKTFTHKNGDVEPVYMGKKGGMYLGRTSQKTGKYYRRYFQAVKLKE